MNLCSRSLTTSINTNTINTKESVMNKLRNLLAIALLSCTGGAFASDNTLQVVITVSIATVNEIEWVFGSDQTAKDGDRTWALSNVNLNTAYLSAADGAMSEIPAGGAAAIAAGSRGVGLDIQNKSVTPISLAIVATTTTWTLAAAPAAVNEYKLEASINNAGAYLAPLVEATPATLANPVAGSAIQTFDLRFTTPATVSTVTAGVCTVTITSTLL
jgi:hypothetical protein